MPYTSFPAKARDQAEGLAFFVPLTKGDPRGSHAFSAPPAARNAAKLSQSFDSLAKGDKASVLARELSSIEIPAIPAFAGMTCRSVPLIGPADSRV